MSGFLFDRYGAILNEDVEVLEACLKAISEHLWRTEPRSRHTRSVRICEIGMHDGGTACGIETFLKSFGLRLDYFGVDPDDGKTRPRYVPAGGTVIIGDSAEVFPQVPDGLDLVWVDGCHCRFHVISDTLHYAPKVRVGGFICFHDTNPAGEGTGHQYHGPDTPEFARQVNTALAALRFPWDGWELFMERTPTDNPALDCGTKAFRRIR